MYRKRRLSLDKLRRDSAERNLIGANIFRNIGFLGLFAIVGFAAGQESLVSYALALAIATPFFVFADMGLRTIFLTTSVDLRFLHFLEIRGLLLIATILGVFLWVTLTPGPPVGILLLVLALKTVDSCTDILTAPLQKNGKSRQVLVWSISANTASLLITLGAVSFGTSSAEIMIGTFTLAYTALSVPLVASTNRIYRLNSQPRPRSSLKSKDRRIILTSGIPFGIGASLLTIVITAPQYALAAYNFKEYVPQFALLMYLPAVTDLIYGGITQAWIPVGKTKFTAGTLTLSSFQKAKKYAIRTLPLAAVAALGTSGAIAFFFQSAVTLNLVSVFLLIIIIASAPFIYFGTISLSIVNKYMSMTWVGLLPAAVSILCSVILIPALQLNGALLAVACAMVVRAAVTYFTMTKLKFQ